MFEMTRPTKEEILENARKQEASTRLLTLRIPAALEDGMTYGQLAEKLGVKLEELIRATIRCDFESGHAILKHPEGRGVSYNGKITNEFGIYE